MNTSLSLPTDLTIDHVGALHVDWRSGPVDDPRRRAAAFEFRVRADLVDDIDAAGLQLLFSLRRSVQALGGLFKIVDPSEHMVFACFALGSASLLAAPTGGLAPSLEEEAQRNLLTVRPGGAAAGPQVFQTVCAAEGDREPGPDERRHVAVAFGRETFRNGMDPIAMLANVHRDGVMTSLRCDVDGIPSLETLDPESCFLACEFDLRTPKSRREVESAFAFIREEDELSATEPAVLGQPARTPFVRRASRMHAQREPLTESPPIDCPERQAHE